MTLSNTAVPRYYGEFREAVLRGDIPVCREISLEMNRIDARIADPNLYYSPEKVEAFIRFAEAEMTLTNGDDLHLLPSFKLWAEQLYGWYYYETVTEYQPNKNGHGGSYVTNRVLRRLIRKQFIIVARGAAKSLYETLIQAYELCVDTTTTHQITVAPTMKMAEEVINPFKTAMTRSKGPLFKFLTEGSLQNTTGSRALRQKLSPTKRGIENFITGSLCEIRVMSIDKLQGLRTKVNTIDEWLSGRTRENIFGAIEQGAAKEPNYIIVAVSSEGTVRNGVGDSVKMELAQILKGEQQAPHTSIFHYKLDDIMEVADPEMWIKAQPNLGVTVSYATYQEDVERAEKNPAVRNDILAKRFGIPMEGYTYFFTYEDTLPHPRREFWNLPCSMGVDLSRGDDFCAFTFLFPLSDRRFGVKTRCYITERTMALLPVAQRLKYEEFMREGSLIVLPGTTLDMMTVYDDLDRHIIDRRYDVRAVGYDPYNAREFIERWNMDNGEYGVEKVIQGARTESVPLGELKILAEDRALIFDESIMSYCMGNAIALEDTNGNRKLSKSRHAEKIDSVSALLDAYVALKLQHEQFD